MKKFFRVALVCALAGATLLYTGCTKDYSEDLHQLTQKVGEAQSQLTSLSGQVADLLKAKEALEKADEEAQRAIKLLEPRVKTLEDNLEKLEQEKTRLEGLIRSNAGDISDLQGKINTINGQISAIQGDIRTINSQISDLDSTVKEHRAALDKIEQDLAKKADRAYVDDELAKKADKAWVETTLQNYATAKALVDTAAALRAKLALVDQEIVGVKDDLSDLTGDLSALGERVGKIADSVKINADDIAKINTAISTMQGDISALQLDMTQAKKDIVAAQHTADSAAALAGSALSYSKKVETWVKTNYYDITSVDKLISELKKAFNDSLRVGLAKKLDITVWEKDTARINAKLNEIDVKIADVIRGYQEGDRVLNNRIDSLDKAINGLLNSKLDTTVFNEFVEKCTKWATGVNVKLDKLIHRVQSIVYVPEYDDNRITLNWAQFSAQNVFDTREVTVPASFSEEMTEFIKKYFGDLPASIEQELIDIAENNPGVIQVIAGDNGSNYPYLPAFGVFPTPEQFNGPSDALYVSTPIVEPSEVKYRIYGEDAATIVDALVESVNEGSDLLAFDVVRVKTRANKDNVNLKITGASNDDDIFSDGSVITLTVVPENLPNDFWLYTWDVKNFMNPKTHILYFQYLFQTGVISQELYTWLYKQYTEAAGVPARLLAVNGADNAAGSTEPSADLEEDTEFPAFRVSLVLTDSFSETTDEETGETVYKGGNNVITSAYNNVVPAANSDKIDIWIRRNGEDVTAKNYADTVEIPYIDLSKYDVLAGTELMFTYKGEDLTADEFEAKGMELGAPVARFFATPDFSESIAANNGDELPVDYFQNAADDDAPVAKVNLKEVIAAGVGAKEVVTLTYFVGPASASTFGLVKVVPVKLEEVVDIWESEDLQPFTWNYTKDAAVDAVLFKGDEATELYRRDSAVAVYDEEKVASDFTKYGIKFEDFEGKTPVADTTFLYATWEDGTVDTVKLADLLASEDTPKFNIYPFFDAEDGNALKANVTNFVFSDLNEDENHGALKQIAYKAVYNLPDDEMPAIEVTVTGKILFADRDRTPIEITLPESLIPYVVDIKGMELDTLYDNAKAIVPQFGETGDYASHSLTDPDLLDAYDQGYSHTDSLTMTVDGVETTKFSKDNGSSIITTVSEELDNHVLDYNTNYTINVSWAADKVIEPYQKFLSIDTLWYGQVVIVNKLITFDVDGIFEFERIPEYVAKTDDLNYYTTLQPWWKPDLATLKPYDVPVNGYDAHQVLLNQHFRVVDVLKTLENIEAGQDPKVAKVVATEIVSVEGSETTDPETGEVTSVEPVVGGDLKPEYKDVLGRVFKLEEPGHVGDTVSFIADPRAEEQPELITALEEKIGNDIKVGVSIDEDNVVSYYSESEAEDAVGNLYLINSNGSMVTLTTNFNRGDKTPSDRLAKAGVVVEHYENYMIKLFDPLRQIEAPEDVQKINVNNSIITSTSIYQFIQLKDKRDYNLIGLVEDGEDEDANPVYRYGWLKGNVDPATKLSVNEDEDPNGFEDGVTTDQVYSLIFTNELEFLSEVSPETQARIKFDEETGELTYDNTLQTQLATPIDMLLKVNIEYPWGTREAAVKIQFYNTPVGE